MPPVAATIPDRSIPKHRHFTRACYSEAASVVRNIGAETILRSKWGDDHAAIHLLQRGAVDAANTTTPGWAKELAQNSFAAFLANLGTASAASRLIEMGLRVNLERNGPTITMPGRSAAITAAPWVEEGKGIPIDRSTLGSIVLGPARKLGAIVAWTEELDRASGAVQIFDQLLREAIGLGLDLAYFSAQAPTAAAHPGLLYNVTPLTASAVGGVAAAQGDLAALAATVSGPGSSGEVAFITSRAGAATLPLALPQTQVTILGSDAVAAGTVIAVDALSIVHGGDREPDISASKNAVLHMDSAPLPISTGPQGSAVVATPTSSMWQQGQIALRALFSVAFVKRRSDAVAWLSGADWNEAAVAGTTRKRSAS